MKSVNGNDGMHNISYRFALNGCKTKDGKNFQKINPSRFVGHEMYSFSVDFAVNEMRRFRYRVRTG